MTRRETARGFVPRLLLIESWPPMQRMLRIAAEAAGFADTTAVASADGAGRALAAGSYAVVLIGSGVSASDRSTILAALRGFRPEERRPRVVSLDPGDFRPDGQVITLRAPVDIDTLRQHLSAACDGARSEGRVTKE